MASGWDPDLERDADECRSVPQGLANVEGLVRSHLDYFDARGISWSASSFTPRKLIFGLNSMEPTQLYKDVT